LTKPQGKKSTRLYESNDYNIKEILSKCEEFPIKKLNSLLSGPSPLPIIKKGQSIKSPSPAQLDPIVPKNFKKEVTQVWENIVRKVNHQPPLVEEPSAEKVRKAAEGINFASDDESITQHQKTLE